MADKHPVLTTYEMVKDDNGSVHWVSHIPSKSLEDKPISLEVLKGNPFFYHYTEGERKVEDIEDFHVTYKHEDYAFRDLIRSHRFSKNKKIKITKKIFARWRKDSQNAKNVSKDKNDRIIAEAQPETPLTLNKSLKVGVIISAVILLAILGSGSSLWAVLKANSHILAVFTTAIANGFVQYALFNIIAHIDLYLMIVWFIYQPYYKYVSNNYYTKYNHTKHHIEKSYNQAGASLKERVDAAEKYYLKHLKSNKEFAPYKMEQVMAPMASLQELEDLAEQTLTQKAQETKTKKFYYVMENMLSISSVVLFAPTAIFALVVFIGGLI